MKKIIIFEGKVTIGGVLVDFRIYRNEDNGQFCFYSYEINPEVKDAGQLGYHSGGSGTFVANTLEELFSKFRIFQGEIKKIDAVRYNKNF